MTADSIELVQRVIRSLDEYFREVSNDRLLAMIMNPLLAIHGFDDIAVLEGEEEGGGLLTRAKNLLKESMLQLTKPTPSTVRSHDMASESNGKYTFYIIF